MSQTNPNPLRVLLVDDDEDDYVFTRDLLADISDLSYSLEWLNDFQQAKQAIERHDHDVYLLDFRLGAHDGLELLHAAKAHDCKAPFILLTGQSDKAIDEAAMAAGAADYLVKGQLDSQQLERSIRYSLKQAHTLEALRHERENLNAHVLERTRALSIANAELAKASKAKDEFLASMSHELRTPLTGILAMAEVLGKEFYGPLNDKQKSYVHTIEESGQHLLALINDILDIAKIEAGKLTLQKAAVNIESVCQAAIRLVRQNAQKRNLHLHSQLDPAVTVLNCDERRLKQMLVNLLSNAVKFTPEHGEMGLQVGPDVDGQHMLFRVWDHGIGISDQQLQQLFQPFVQLDSSLSRPYQGSGLGLSLVKRMAELHGGDIQVASQPGQGSVFTLRLPLSSNTSQPAKPDSPTVTEGNILSTVCRQAQENSAGPLILLADDDDFNIAIYEDFLSSLGYRLNIAKDGLQALACVAQQMPDLILMDIQMPHMDGLEAIRHLRADPATQHLPIIALTAMAMAGDREFCLQAGASRYLSKPVGLDALNQNICELIAGA